MMRIQLRHHLWICAVAASLAFSGTASAQKLSKADSDKITKDLEKIENLLKDAAARNNFKAMTKFKAAGASPQKAIDYYLDCKKQIDFIDKGKKDSEWREFRTKFREDERSNAFGKALQYQLKYLALSIRACGMKEEDDEKVIEELLPDVISFLSTITDNYQEIYEHRSRVRGSGMGSAFAQRHKLEATLKRRPGWVFAPLAIDQIYEGMILPYYRKNNPAKLDFAWGKRISQLTKLEKASEKIKIEPDNRDRSRVREARRRIAQEEEQDFEEFKEERIPELKWEQLVDAFVFGKSQAATANKMTALVKGNLDHNSALSWLKEIKVFVSGEFDPKDYIGGPEAEDEDLFGR